jgi:predicted ribosomally synthesized peptide with nif11-like leader
MSITDLQAKMASDPAFANKIKGCKNAEEIIAVAKDAGITLSNADIATSVASSDPFELSDEELESVSSGTVLAALLVK